MSWLQTHWHHICASIGAALAFIYRIDLLIWKIYNKINSTPKTLPEINPINKGNTMTITVAQLESGVTSFNAILTEIINVEGNFALFLPANVTAAFATIKAFETVLPVIEADVEDVIAKVETAWAQAYPSTTQVAALATAQVAPLATAL